MIELAIRLNAENDAYEIVFDDEILDFISMHELLTAEVPHRLVDERVKRVGNRLRARRFVAQLEQE